MISVGSHAPNFTASALGRDGIEQTVSLSDYKGQKVVLYFYPKDNTPGCTQQACDFRDVEREVSALGAVVLGVSKDSIKSHLKFHKDFSLPFPLISDENTNISETYEVWIEKSMYGKKYFGIERSTFIIDADGIIQEIWRGVSPQDHHLKVLEALKKI